MTFRKLIFSCNTFGGFTVDYELKTSDTLEDLVRYGVKTLKETLNIFDFECLLEQLQTKKYHIHDRTMKDIGLNNNPVYICACTTNPHCVKE